MRSLYRYLTEAVPVSRGTILVIDALVIISAIDLAANILAR